MCRGPAPVTGAGPSSRHRAGTRAAYFPPSAESMAAQKVMSDAESEIRRLPTPKVSGATCAHGIRPVDVGANLSQPATTFHAIAKSERLHAGHDRNGVDDLRAADADCGRQRLLARWSGELRGAGFDRRCRSLGGRVLCGLDSSKRFVERRPDRASCVNGEACSTSSSMRAPCGSRRLRCDSCNRDSRRAC
jgi:hypothetical protein